MVIETAPPGGSEEMPEMVIDNPEEKEIIPQPSKNQEEDVF